jgi:hypothetical protein
MIFCLQEAKSFEGEERRQQLHQCQQRGLRSRKGSQLHRRIERQKIQQQKITVWLRFRLTWCCDLTKHFSLSLILLQNKFV